MYIGTQDHFGNVRIPSGGLDPVVCGTTTGHNIATDACTRGIHYFVRKSVCNIIIIYIYIYCVDFREQTINLHNVYYV